MCSHICSIAQPQVLFNTRSLILKITNNLSVQKIVCATSANDDYLYLQCKFSNALTNQLAQGTRVGICAQWYEQGFVMRAQIL